MSDQSGSSIAEFLAGKNVFLTGGTGFVGQCLIERLLASTSEIGKIYVLIRPKNNYTAESRLEKLLSKPVSYSLLTYDLNHLFLLVFWFSSSFDELALQPVLVLLFFLRN
jgi:hypothetical protein